LGMMLIRSISHEHSTPAQLFYPGYINAEYRYN
jgi:hypothetical protein